MKNKKLRSPGGTETEDAAAAVGVPAAAERDADVVGVVEPAAAAQDPVHAIVRADGVRHRPGWVIAVPVLAPFPDVAVDVVQTEAVGAEAADRRGAGTVPLAAAIKAVGIVDPGLVTPPIEGLGPGAGGILPLCLARQTTARPGAEVHRLLPVHVVHWMVFVAGIVPVGPVPRPWHFVDDDGKASSF